MRKIALMSFLAVLIFSAANLRAEGSSDDNISNLFSVLHLEFGWDESKNEGMVDQKIPVGKKSFHFLSGATASKNGINSYNSGIGYANTVNGFRVDMNTRNNWDVKGVSNDYISNSAEITYPIFKRIFIGGLVEYSLWWEVDRDWILAGPIVYYHISDNLSLDVRPSSEWDRISGYAEREDKIGMNLKYSF